MRETMDQLMKTFQGPLILSEEEAERLLCLIRQTLDMAEETRNEVVEISRKLKEHTRILRKLGRNQGMLFGEESDIADKNYNEYQKTLHDKLKDSAIREAILNQKMA